VRLWTIGHSTRSLDEFLALLAPHGIEAIADVRRYPGSRRLPHFGQEALAASLAGARVRYAHLPELGGRRRPRPDSPNTAWRDDAPATTSFTSSGPARRRRIRSLRRRASSTDA